MFGIPIALVILILLRSPNFDSVSVDRSTPWGSDFLQEWVGGHIWLSNQRNDLYSAKHFQAVQHDPGVVGFSWSNEQYYPMVYPPFYYMILSPLATIPYKVATGIWLLGLGLISGATLFCFCSYFEPARQHWGKCLIGLIAFCPFLISLNMAHKSVLLLLIVTLTWLLLYHRKPFLSGLMFGLIAFKPHLGILIGLAMLYKGQWRFVAGCLGAVSVLVALSFIAGPELCYDYFLQSLAAGDYSQNVGYKLAESHNLAGAMQLTFGNTQLATAISSALTIFVLLLLVVALRGPLNFRSSRFAVQFSLLIIATILTSPHFYLYDLTILLLPIALIMFVMGNQLPRVVARPELGGTEQRIQTVLCLILFVVTGLSTMIAERLDFQPTIVILLLMAVISFRQLFPLSKKVATVCPVAS